MKPILSVLPFLGLAEKAMSSDYSRFPAIYGEADRRS
jgi:hypothetical protein